MMETNPSPIQNLVNFDVVLKYPSDEQHLVQNVTVQILKTHNIALSDVFTELARRNFSFSDGCQVLYYSVTNKWFVFCGLYPQFEVNEIPVSTLIENKLILRFQASAHNSIIAASVTPCPVITKDLPLLKTKSSSSVKTLDELESNFETPISCKTDFTGSLDSDEDSRPKRSAERKLSQVIKAVAKWRRLFKGVPQEDGTMAKYSLEDAAKKVGISKKSLDDYLLQIRYGKKFNFDFQKHKNQGIGILRAFNKKHRELAKKDPASMRTTPVIKRNRYKLVESEDEDEETTTQKCSTASSSANISLINISSRTKTRATSVKVATPTVDIERNPVRVNSLPISTSTTNTMIPNFESQVWDNGSQQSCSVNDPQISQEVNNFFGLESQQGQTPTSRQYYDNDGFDIPATNFFAGWDRERVTSYGEGNSADQALTPRGNGHFEEQERQFPFF